MGSIGAAFLVTYWGVLHSLLQYLVTYFALTRAVLRWASVIVVASSFALFVFHGYCRKDR